MELRGKLDGKSIDQKALSLVLHARSGDSGGGVFLDGHLIGLLESGKSAESSSTITTPFSCAFDEPYTKIHYDPVGTPLQNDTIAIAITENIIATAMKEGSVHLVPTPSADP